MRINDILHSRLNKSDLITISEQCGQFLDESNHLPITKLLPSSYEDFRKVKVRKRGRRKNDAISFTNAFNEAFDDKLWSIRERALYAQGGNIQITEDTDSRLEPFYVFPIDGYNYIYSNAVTNSSTNYQCVVDSVFKELGCDGGDQLLQELLKFSYQSTNLSEGIARSAEIIFYNVPYFYAVRTSCVSSYDDLLTNCV